MAASKSSKAGGAGKGSAKGGGKGGSRPANPQATIGRGRVDVKLDIPTDAGGVAVQEAPPARLKEPRRHRLGSRGGLGALARLGCLGRSHQMSLPLGRMTRTFFSPSNR